MVRDAVGFIGHLGRDFGEEGQGISAEHMKSLFVPFFTTAPGRGGSGLGLHISHTLVTSLLGGRMGVESKPGQGCRVTVLLPQSAPSIKQAGMPSAPAPLDAGKTDQGLA